MPGSAGYQTWREGDFFSFSERVDYANNKERKFSDIEERERERESHRHGEEIQGTGGPGIENI